MPVFEISCVTRDGLTPMLDSLVERISREFRQDPSEGLHVTHARHRALLQDAVDHLGRFLVEFLFVAPCSGQPSSLPPLLDNASQNQIVFAAEDLRHAATSIGRITGRVEVDEVLDVLFKDFCIGK